MDATKNNLPNKLNRAKQDSCDELSKVKHQKKELIKELKQVKQTNSDLKNKLNKVKQANLDLGSKLNRVKQDTDDELSKVKHQREELTKELKQVKQTNLDLENKLNRVKQNEEDKSKAKMSIHGWNIQKSGGYYRLFKKISGRVHGIYLGKTIKQDIARKKISIYMEKLVSKKGGLAIDIKPDN
ncbi:hypothetical protein MHK_005892 [Candidatus Magnetomorum sp. HK-1]|nr:hypothetical protein MHK_005892 [Candidatus Magnetomorum sp. HK-1]